jgi:hypothetical protein
MELFSQGQVKRARLRMQGFLCRQGLDRASASEWADLWVDARLKGVSAREIYQGVEAILDGEVMAA